MAKIGEFLTQNMGGIVGGISNILTTSMQNKANRQMAQEQNLKNMELSRYQYEMQKKAYDEANLYNTPSAQMQRYKDAGLNPNLIYGQGSSGNAPNVLPQYRSPEYITPQKQAVSPMASIAQAMNMKLQIQELRNAQAQGRILDANATRASNEAFYSGDYYGRRNWSMFLKNSELDDIRHIRQQITNENVNLNPMFRDYTQSKWLTPSKQLSNYNAQIALSNARTQLTDLEIGAFVPRWLNSAIGAGAGLVKSAIGGLGKIRPVVTGKSIAPSQAIIPKYKVYTRY